jgi:hypothetical protein
MVFLTKNGLTDRRDMLEDEVGFIEIAFLKTG